jgi:hypothetical protein
MLSRYNKTAINKYLSVTSTTQLKPKQEERSKCLHDLLVVTCHIAEDLEDWHYSADTMSKTTITDERPTDEINFRTASNWSLDTCMCCFVDGAFCRNMIKRVKHLYEGFFWDILYVCSGCVSLSDRISPSTACSQQCQKKI